MFCVTKAGCASIQDSGQSYKGTAGSGKVRIKLDAHFSALTIAHHVESAKAKNKREAKM
jgi:hypothetical protein